MVYCLENVIRLNRGEFSHIAPARGIVYDGEDFKDPIPDTKSRKKIRKHKKLVPCTTGTSSLRR